jgi:hypothetical protein
LAASAIFVICFTSACASQPGVANAQTILQHAQSTPNVNNLKQDEYVKLVRTLYTRPSPAKLRPDPYHTEETDIYTETNWIRGGLPLTLRFEKRNGSTGQLVSVIQIADEKMRIYDALRDSEQAVIYPKATPSANSTTDEVMRQYPKAQIDSQSESEWKTPAWFLSSPIVEAVKGGVSSGYTGDITSGSLRKTWVIDQNTNLVIRTELLIVQR